MIRVHNLHKIYGEGLSSVHALKGIDLRVATGEFVAIMGRSGSGKSTVLHLLGLLDKPTEGDIYIEDANVLSLSDKEQTRFRLRELGYVFQEYSLISELTALENVFLPAIGIQTGKGYKSYARELLDVVGLSERINHYPNELSGGEQQRVSIARALINKPKILFADEPTASLDAESADIVLRLFRRLNKEMRQTVVMVTHESEDRQYVDRVIGLKDGHIDDDLRKKHTGKFSELTLLK
jgi:putative ABC transport system ATP-binding protein